MLRTHNCGELKAKDAGKKVTLCGWVDTVRVQGKIGFLLLKDRHGITQVFLSPKFAKEFGTMAQQSVLLVNGNVNKRPENQVRKEVATGEIEVAAESIELISKAETP